MKQHFILSAIFILVLSFAPAFAQGSADGSKTFAKDGLSFSYPSGWTLTDKSNAQAQHLILSQEKSSVIIMVVAYRELLQSEEQFYVGIRGITEPYVESIQKNFASSGRKVRRDNPCIEMEGVKISGVRLQGFYQNEPSTGDVYYFVRGRRFVNLIYIRADKDAPRGNSAWEAVHSSITIDKPATADAPGLLMPNIVSGGFLNSKAVRLPMPDYSSFAKRGGASGLVVVEVTIDEQGNVTSATAVKGHPLLKKASEDAARGAKFPPVIICGQPVKVTGTISYNFVS